MSMPSAGGAMDPRVKPEGDTKAVLKLPKSLHLRRSSSFDLREIGNLSEAVVNLLQQPQPVFP